jgi:hypothetical protein
VQRSYPAHIPPLCPFTYHKLFLTPLSPILQVVAGRHILAEPCFEDAAARVTKDAVAKDTGDSLSPTSTDDPVELVKAVVDAEEEEQNQLLIAAMLAADKAEDEEEQEDLQAASARSEEADARSSKGAVAAVDAGCFCKVRLA